MRPDVKKLKLETLYWDKRPLEPASEAEVLRFEKMLGYSLPLDYRDFLLQINGGIPSCNPPPSFRTRNGLRLRLGDLCNFGIKNKLALLPMSWKDLRNAIPRFLLPIGMAGANDDVMPIGQSPVKHPDYFGLFLGLSEPVRGQVFLVSNKNFSASAASKEPEFLSASGVFKVADSFTEFINSLEC